MGAYEQPLIRTHERSVAAVGAGADLTTPIDVVGEDGVVSKVTYVPVAAVTGANTNTRTLSLVNKGSAGAGSTVVATLALTSGNNLSADTPNTIAISTGKVSAGDVLEWTSVHAASGLADPGGLVHVEISRS
jgi:hypothetical protein